MDTAIYSNPNYSVYYSFYLQCSSSEALLCSPLVTIFPERFLDLEDVRAEEMTELRILGSQHILKMRHWSDNTASDFSGRKRYS